MTWQITLFLCSTMWLEGKLLWQWFSTLFCSQHVGLYGLLYGLCLLRCHFWLPEDFYRFCSYVFRSTVCTAVANHLSLFPRWIQGEPEEFFSDFQCCAPNSHCTPVVILLHTNAWQHTGWKLLFYAVKMTELPWAFRTLINRPYICRLKGGKEQIVPKIMVLYQGPSFKRDSYIQ